MGQIMNWIIMFNLICLIGLVAGIRQWQKKHDRLTEKRFALILTGYFSFSFITTLLPLLITHPRETTIVDIIFLLILWSIGYPWIRWLYRQFNSSK
jgi:Ca2+/Na+ antiporter